MLVSTDLKYSYEHACIVASTNTERGNERNGRVLKSPKKKKGAILDTY